MVRKESNRLIMKRPNHRNTHLAQFCALRSGTASAFLIFLINANFLFSAKSVFKTVQIVNLKKNQTTFQCLLSWEQYYYCAFQIAIFVLCLKLNEFCSSFLFLEMLLFCRMQRSHVSVHKMLDLICNGKTSLSQAQEAFYFEG